MSQKPGGSVITKDKQDKPELPQILKSPPPIRHISYYPPSKEDEWRILSRIPKGDPLSIMWPREGELQIFKDFKEEIVLNVGVYGGAVALALEMCDKPKVYEFVEEALNERGRKGYKEEPGINIYSLSAPGIFKFTSILSEIRDGKSVYTPFLNMEHDGPITYDDLKGMTRFPLVKDEISALRTLFEGYPDELKKRITLLTLHADKYSETYSKDAAKFAMDYLKIAKLKNLYEGEFGFADIGTAHGTFTDGFVSFIKENFDGYKIIRTNPLEFEDAPKDVIIHDITEAPLDGKFNMIVIKDVTNFFTSEGRENIWGNVNKSAEEGCIIISGAQSEFDVHVKFNGALVRLRPEAFLEQLNGVKDVQDYLRNLGKIVDASRYTTQLSVYRTSSTSLQIKQTGFFDMRPFFGEQL